MLDVAENFATCGAAFESLTNALKQAASEQFRVRMFVFSRHLDFARSLFCRKIASGKRRDEMVSWIII